MMGARPGLIDVVGRILFRACVHSFADTTEPTGLITTSRACLEVLVSDRRLRGVTAFRFTCTESSASLTP